MNITVVLSWLVAWTSLGGVVLLLTKGLTRRVCGASLRHLAWSAAFLCLFLLPVCQVTSSLVRESIATGQGNGILAAGNEMCALVPSEPNGFVAGLLWVWVAGIGWMFVRSVLAWSFVSQWRKHSLPYLPDSGISTDEFRNIEVRIALEGNLVVPITWGWRRPVVLLPQAAREWDESRIAAVLWHELGHIRRFDNLTQRLVLLLSAIHWFNPVFWIAARQMEAESEIAADDFAILRGVKPSNYAAELLAIAGQLRSGAWRCPFAQTAMVKSFTLEERLRSIIDPQSRRGGVPLLSRAKIAGTFAGVAVALMVSTPRLAKLIEPRAVTPAHCLVTEHESSTNDGL